MSPTSEPASKGQESEGILNGFCVGEGCSDVGVRFLLEEFVRQGQIGGESFRVNTIKRGDFRRVAGTDVITRQNR